MKLAENIKTSLQRNRDIVIAASKPEGNGNRAHACKAVIGVGSNGDVEGTASTINTHVFNWQVPGDIAWLIDKRFALYGVESIKHRTVSEIFGVALALFDFPPAFERPVDIPDKKTVIPGFSEPNVLSGPVADFTPANWPPNRAENLLINHLKPKKNQAFHHRLCYTQSHIFKHKLSTNLPLILRRAIRIQKIRRQGHE